MDKTLICVSREFGKDEFVVVFSTDEKKIEIPCNRYEWTAPFYGKELSKNDIQELIIFLHECIREGK